MTCSSITCVSGAFIVIDLKIEDFKPEFAGKMNFYLSAVDDLLRHAEDQPSIGIILCKGRNEVVVEYALRDTKKPMGVSEYRLTHALPARLRDELPTLEDLAKEFPLLSLVHLLIAVERMLTEILRKSKPALGEAPRAKSLGQLSAMAFDVGLISVDLRAKIRSVSETLDRTVHGQETSHEAAEATLLLGTEILSELKLVAAALR